MCADGKRAYRNAGDTCRKGEELWALSPHNPKNKEKRKQSTGTDFLEDHVK